jgi:hypothetical protein
VGAGLGGVRNFAYVVCTYSYVYVILRSTPVSL